MVNRTPILEGKHQKCNYRNYIVAGVYTGESLFGCPQEKRVILMPQKDNQAAFENKCQLNLTLLVFFYKARQL